MSNESVLLQEAFALYEAGMPGAALAVCEEVTARDNHSALAHNYAGFACLRLGRMDQAIAEFREAVRRDPNNADFYIGLADAYGSSCFRGAERRRALQQANTLRMPEWKRETIEGKLAETEGDYGCALGCFRRAALDAPEERNMEAEIGRVLALMKRTREARDVLRASASRPTATSMTWFNLGRCEQKMGNFGAAAEDFERALTMNSYNQLALYRLMQVSFARRQWQRGFQQLRALWRLMLRTVIEEDTTLKQKGIQAEEGR